MTDKELIEKILNHPQLHDLITHLSDFFEATHIVLKHTSPDLVDDEYWKKQQNTIVTLQNFINANNDGYAVLIKEK